VAKIGDLNYLPENCESDSNDDVRRPVWLRPIGVSMKPTIRPGNRVLLMPASINGPKNGAMVCFYHPDMRDYVLHRVIKTKNGFCLTCGDNNIYPDPPVAFADLVGEAVAVDFNKGCTYPLNRKWVRKWGGMDFCIFTLCDDCEKDRAVLAISFKACEKARSFHALPPLPVKTYFRGIGNG